jgi:hypothetical protein
VLVCVITRTASLMLGFRHDVDEICALVGYYVASCGNCLPTFRDYVSAPSSRVKSRPHCDVDSICAGVRVLVISKRGDSQWS